MHQRWAMGGFAAILATFVGFGAWQATARAQDKDPAPAEKQSDKQTARQATATVFGGAGDAKLTREQLEERLSKTLTNCVMRGTFQPADEASLLGKGQLKPAEPDRYVIESAGKASDGRWQVRARIDHGGNSAILPIMVDVAWADDTPVIVVRDLAVPGIGTYSARVMIFGNFYTGVWFGDCYGGVMSGQIVRQEDEEEVFGLQRAEAAEPAGE